MKVGCAGILVADTFCGPMPALPAEGELLAVASMPTRPGGCAANVAIDLAKQGVAEVEICGCVGRDAGGRMLVESLGKTMAEIPLAEKNRLSHRAVAFRALATALTAEGVG